MQEALNNIVTLIDEDFGYTVYVATEIEFYFSDGDASKDNEVLAHILKQCTDDELVISNMTFETGERQYEIALTPVNNTDIVCEHTNTLKRIITEVAAKFDIEVSFEAKPFSNQPGCGLHIHLHLENSSRFNIFQKPIADNDAESEALIQCVGGLLDTMLESMIYFAPNADDYSRFTARTNEDTPEDAPLRRYNNAPIKVNWGSNNRTVAVRIPASTRHPEQRHIEHRVSSPDADIYKVMTAVIAGIHHGLSHNIQPTEKIHGNAFDSQYDRPLLPKSLEEAQKLADNSRIIKAYL